MNKGKYKEGQVCELNYVKDIFIEEEFMVLEDKDKERFLIPSHYYKSYKLVKDHPVKCLVTRVDCAGKISFEPEHPCYSLGGIYLFNFVSMQISEENEYNPITGQTKIIKDYRIVVSDCFGNYQHVFPHEWQKKKNFKAEKIKCRVNKIIKGHFHLTNLEEPRPFVRKIIDNFKSKMHQGE
jgi:hypothetical protein